MIARRSFLATTATAAAATGISDAPVAAGSPTDAAFMSLLTETADRRAAELLTTYGETVTDLRDRGRARAAARALRTFTSVYVHEDSAYHHSRDLLGPLGELADVLAAEQYDDGLYDQGAVHSPPDTAFSVVDLNLAYALLERDGHRATEGVRRTVAGVLRKAGRGSRTGVCTRPTIAGWCARRSPGSTAGGPTRRTRGASTPGWRRASTGCRAASTASAAPPTRPWSPTRRC
ncbi:MULTISPECIES: hypothetical protein [unclassified Streptomyces]|uniref:hypothetical protein n=1 Tax=unclassified Streptomyces TaxID=2593676 RepID=UPI0019D0AAA2|nr:MULTISPECIES: hypothetical protein [unclassified Streptomyces]